MNVTDKIRIEQSKAPNLQWFKHTFKNIGWSNHHDLYKG